MGARWGVRRIGAVMVACAVAMVAFVVSSAAGASSRRQRATTASARVTHAASRGTSKTRLGAASKTPASAASNTPPPAGAIPLGQTFGGAALAVNPTEVDDNVNSYSGALETSYTDIRVAGIGVPFALDRQYNSRAVGLSGSFGPGWWSILDTGISFSSTGSRAYVFGPDGQQVGFTHVAASDSWTRDPGVRASLACSGPATGGVAPASCTLTRFSDGSTLVFGNGYIKHYRAADGQGLTFTENGAHRVNSVVLDTTASTALVVHMTRDAHGRVTKVTTPTRSVSYSYSTAGDLATVTEPSGVQWRMTYASGHLLKTVTAFASSTAKAGKTVMSASYDSSTGRVSSVVQDVGTHMDDTTFGWTAGTSAGSGEGFREELVDVGGNLTRETYTDTYASGHIAKRTDPIGATVADTWNSDLDLLTVKNALGATETMTYNGSGDELSDDQTLDRSGDVEHTTLAYDANNRLTSSKKQITSSLADTSTYSYNSLGELTQSTKSGGGTTKYTYNSHGLRATQTDAQGDVTTFSYDAAGNLTNQYVTMADGSRPQGNGPLNVYDEAGDQVLSVPAVGNEGGGNYVTADATTMTYSADGRETKVASPGGARETTSYAPDGQVTSSTDAAGNKTTYTWAKATLPGGGAGWERKTVGPSGTEIDIYDPNGNVVESIPPQPSSTVSGKPSGVVIDTYDAAGRLVGRKNGQGISTSYKLDRLGDVTQTSTRAVVTTATFNLVGWATGTSTTTRGYDPNQVSISGNWVPDTKTTATTYDLAGDVLSKTDTGGGTTNYTYLSGDRVGSVTDKFGTTSYTYDDLGDKTSVRTPGGGLTTYKYDALGRETEQIIGQRVWTMAYNADGKPIQTVNPDGGTATYTYDGSDRKTRVTYSWASGHSGPRAPTVHYYYNSQGERTKMVDGAGTDLYSYDSEGRMLSKEIQPTNGISQSFTYDYSKPDQLTEVYPDGTSVVYHTDDGGNLLGLTAAATDGSPPFSITSTEANTLVTQGASSNPTSGSSSNANTSMPPSSTLYPDGEYGYPFTSPYTVKATGAQSWATGEGFYTASTVNSETGTNADNPQAGYEAQSDVNGNLLEEQWDPLPFSTSDASDVSLIDELYGYNGGTAGAAASEGTGAGSAGVRLTTWTANYNDSSTSNQDWGNYAYNANGEPTEIVTGIGPTNNWNAVAWTFNYGSNGEISSAQTTGPNPSNTGQAPQFGYDGAGDLNKADVEPPLQTLPQPGIQWSFKYNNAGQLALATETGGAEQIAYSYDGDGNLVAENESGGSFLRLSFTWDPRTPTPQLDLAYEQNQNFQQFSQRYFWGNGVAGMEENDNGQVTPLVYHDSQNGTPTMITQGGCTANSCPTFTRATYYYDPFGNFIQGKPLGTVMGNLIGFDGSFADPITGLNLMGSRWYDPNLGMFMSRPSATAPATGSSSMTSGANSSVAEGMSDSPGTAPSLPVAPPSTNYTFAADSPTSESEPTGSALVSAAEDAAFENIPYAQSISTLYSKIQPWTSGTLGAVEKAPYDFYKAFKEEKSQSPSASEEAAAGTEESAEGSVNPEEADVAENAGNDAADVGKIGEDVADEADKDGGLGIGDVINIGVSAYQAYEACQGVSAQECAGVVVGTVVGDVVGIVCQAATDGAGSVACGIMQNALSQLIPLIVDGNGQALLQSTTFNSGFNSDNAQTLGSQAVFAGALGPFGMAALEGEVIYANWTTIQSGLVTAGDALENGLETAGQPFANAFETGAGGIVSGISTANELFASGFSNLASAFSALNDTNITNTIDSLASKAASIADDVGSALCDGFSAISCAFGSIFDSSPPPNHAQSNSASAATGRRLARMVASQARWLRSHTSLVPRLAAATAQGTLSRGAAGSIAIRGPSVSASP